MSEDERDREGGTRKTAATDREALRLDQEIYSINLTGLLPGVFPVVIPLAALPIAYNPGS